MYKSALAQTSRQAGRRTAEGRAIAKRCIQEEGRATGALSTTITPPHIHGSALGLPSQLLGQLSNQVSRLFLRPPWSIVPSPRLVCGPQLWRNDVISDPKAGRVSQRKHGAGVEGLRPETMSRVKLCQYFWWSLHFWQETKKKGFQSHVCHSFPDSASGGLSTLGQILKKAAFYSCIYILLFFSKGIGQYYCHNQYALSEDWLLGWCAYLLQWGHCEAIIFTKSFL